MMLGSSAKTSIGLKAAKARPDGAADNFADEVIEGGITIKST
jgi:hypothetical protein